MILNWGTDMPSYLTIWSLQNQWLQMNFWIQWACFDRENQEDGKKERKCYFMSMSRMRFISTMACQMLCQWKWSLDVMPSCGRRVLGNLYLILSYPRTNQIKIKWLYMCFCPDKNGSPFYLTSIMFYQALVSRNFLMFGGRARTSHFRIPIGSACLPS